MTGVSDAGSPMSADEIKQTQLALLDELVAFCRAHDLRVWLAYGTLLGAVRHGGMIPWDDDIDVLMPSDDYRRLIELAQATGGKLVSDNVVFLAPPVNRQSLTTYGKLIDTRTVTAEDVVDVDNREHLQGVWVDVFPLYGVCDTSTKQRLGYWLYSIPAVMMRLASWKQRPASTWWGQIGRSMLRAPARLIGYEFFGSLTDRILAAWFPDFSRASQVFSDVDMSRSYPRDFFAGTTDIEFEGKMYPVPHRYHEFLVSRYGEDYMIPPPPEQRVAHDMNARWRHEA